MNQQAVADRPEQARGPEEERPYWLEERATPEGYARFRAKIGGLHCSLCTGTIEKALGRQPGVRKVAVSLTHEQTLVEFDPELVRADELLRTLSDIGYTIYDPRKLRPYEEEEAELVREGRRLFVSIGFSLVTIALILQVVGWWSIVVPAVVITTLVGFAYLILRGQGRRAAVAGVVGLVALTALVLALHALGIGTVLVPWLVGAFAVVVVFGVAEHILVMAWQSLRRGILNQHVMLEAGAFAGLAGGLIGLIFCPAGYPTAPFFAVSVLVVNYHIFSEWLSLLVKTRSSQAVRRLLDLQPETARVVERRDEPAATGEGDERGQGGHTSQEREIPLGAVRVGDLVRVRPGERIPVDGMVVSGHSAVDQALVTGEPVPVEKQRGETVIGGSINGTGTLLVEVTAVGAATFLQQVIRQLEDARALKPGLLHLVDRILRIYTPAVLIIALLATAGWALGSWLVTGIADVERAVFAGLSVLVMGYPCAVGIAAPLSIVRGAGEAAAHGVIMRTGEAFQAFRAVRTIVLDKTGTLTIGHPTVREVVPVVPVTSAGAAGAADDGDSGANAAAGELLAVAAAAEAASEHPLGEAVLRAALDRGLAVPDVVDFEAVTGRGVSAMIAGARVLVGRPGFLVEHGVDVAPLARQIERLEAAGRTVIAVSQAGRLLGVLGLGDELRPDAAEAVAAMRAAGMRPVLVTGDNQPAAERIAHAVGIAPEDVYAGVLPGRKAEIVRELQREGQTGPSGGRPAGQRVAMVGDGINDAPALMQADVGIAMGSGTDIAIESADIIVVTSRLGAIVTAREISRRSYRKTRQNVALAFLFNGLGIPAAATGLVYPVWAMVAMAASVTAIFLNSLWGRPALLFEALTSVGRGASAVRAHEQGE